MGSNGLKPREQEDIRQFCVEILTKVELWRCSDRVAISGMQTGKAEVFLISSNDVCVWYRHYNVLGTAFCKMMDL